jgi:hypothetical protein
MVSSMKRLTSRHMLVNFWIALALTFINPTWVKGGESGTRELKEPSGSRSVTHYQQPPGGQPVDTGGNACGQADADAELFWAAHTRAKDATALCGAAWCLGAGFWWTSAPVEARG